MNLKKLTQELQTKPTMRELILPRSQVVHITFNGEKLLK